MSKLEIRAINLVGLLCMVCPFIPEMAVVIGATMCAVVFMCGVLLFVVTDDEQNTTITKLQKELKDQKVLTDRIQNERNILIRELQNHTEQLSK